MALGIAMAASPVERLGIAMAASPVVLGIAILRWRWRWRDGRLLERHRLVNDTLAELMPQIHAFSMKTWTPEQYEKKKFTRY